MADLVHDAIMIMRPKKYDKPGVARITIIIFHLALTHRIITTHELYQPFFLQASFVIPCRARDFVLPTNQMLVSFSLCNDIPWYNFQGDKETEDCVFTYLTLHRKVVGRNIIKYFN